MRKTTFPVKAMRAAIKAPLKCLPSAALLTGRAEVFSAGKVPVGAAGEVVEATLEDELVSAAEVVAVDPDEAVTTAAVAGEVVAAPVTLVTLPTVLTMVVTVEFMPVVVGKLDLHVT